MSEYDFESISKWLADHPEKPPLSILISISKKFESCVTEEVLKVGDPMDQKEEAEKDTHLTKSPEAELDFNSALMNHNAMRLSNVYTPSKRKRGNGSGSYTLW